MQAVCTSLQHDREITLTSPCRAYLDALDDSTPTFLATLTSFLSVIWTGEVVAKPSVKVSSPQIGSKDDARKEITASAFAQLPPPSACFIFLPFYDLLNSNKGFLSLLLAQHGRLYLPMISYKTISNWPLGFLGIFLSTASYLLCHAATSERSRVYSRVLIILLDIIVTDAGIEVLTADEHNISVRLCRQKLPMLPYASNERRPLICSILDNLLIYLRHNLSRKLDIDTHMQVIFSTYLLVADLFLAV